MPQSSDTAKQLKDIEVALYAVGTCLCLALEFLPGAFALFVLMFAAVFIGGSKSNGN